jgi:UPF0755 protein
MTAIELGIIIAAPTACTAREPMRNAGLVADPASSDPTSVTFVVATGETPADLAPKLQAAGLITSQPAFLFLAREDNLAPQLMAGNFQLAKNMTPEQVVQGLIHNQVVEQATTITFREGLRIEQMTALLGTLQSSVDPKDFYDLAMHPPKELLDDYPWLEAAGLPKGASLEGFLYPATYTLVTGSSGGTIVPTTAEDLVRMLLDKFYAEVGQARMSVPASRGMTFYQILSLASIVEHEAPLDAERPKIAGVYQNRLNGLNGVPKLLDADPTVIYGVDTVALSKLEIGAWKDYFFWDVPKAPMNSITLPKALAGYQTYQHAGLIPGPIATPTLSSIDAALTPDTKSGYLYFVAIPGTSQHAFAKTLAEHNANLRKYGYR